MLFAFIVVAGALFALYLQLPMFGQWPQGERLARIEKSPNYRNGQFHNIHETQILLKNPFRNMLRFLFRNESNLRPQHHLPSVKTNLKDLNINDEILIWFGHSSYFLQLYGKRILVDPLFSEVSSPALFFPRAFAGTNSYKPEDMPKIDYLIITHDHWDHLDYQTVIRLKHKTKKVICPLGVGAHFEFWGFQADQIIEMDWGEETVCDKDFSIYCLPARHFSGRGIFRNKSLWASFLIKSDDFKIYFSGDSGYDNHYKEIGDRFGEIDLAILDSGQHDQNWKYIHMMTDEVIKASKDLKAKMLLPSHICKLCLANHAWDEPLDEISEMAKSEKLSVLTPIIGRRIELKSRKQTANHWWKGVKK